MRLRSDDDLYRVRSVWLGPTGTTLPWAARYLAYGVGLGFAVFVLLLRAATPLSGTPGTWDVGFVVLATYAVMGVVDHDRPVRSVIQTCVAEARAPRNPKPTARRATVRVRIKEPS